MPGLIPAAGKPVPPSSGLYPPLIGQPVGPVQPRGLGSDRLLNQGPKTSAARAALALAAVFVFQPASHRGPLQVRSSDAPESPPKPPSDPSTLDDLKAALSQGQRIEPAEFSRIFSDHMSQKFNSHPLIDALKWISENKETIPKGELEELKSKLIIATSEMGLAFPDLCRELGRMLENDKIKDTPFYKLFSDHIKEDGTHARKFYWPAYRQLKPVSFSELVKSSIDAQENDLPLIKVFQSAMRLENNPLALHALITAIEESGAPVFEKSSEIWPDNSFLGKAHHKCEDGHEQAEEVWLVKFLQATDKALDEAGFSPLRDSRAQLEAIQVGEEAGAAMAEYLDGILHNITPILGPLKNGPLPEAAPDPEVVKLFVRYYNGVVGSFNIIRSLQQISNSDKGLLENHERLKGSLLALSELMSKKHPGINSHLIIEAKFFTPDGDTERRKVIEALRGCTLAGTVEKSKAALSSFYQLMIDELEVLSISDALKSDCPESGNPEIKELIKQIETIQANL
jgi:hypothetical protein